MMLRGWTLHLLSLYPAGSIVSHFTEGKAETWIKDLSWVTKNLVNQTKERMPNHCISSPEDIILHLTHTFMFLQGVKGVSKVI